MIARAAMMCALGVLAGCGGRESAQTAERDARKLDSISLRADSLLAIALQPATIDSSLFRIPFDSVLAPDTTAGAIADERSAGDVGRPDSSRGASPSSRRVAADTAIGAGQTSTLLNANPMSRRAQARGDSMARAAAQRVARETMSERSRADTVRGTVVLVGNAPAQSAMLKTPHASLITLSGMGSRGLRTLAGADIVARGVRVSPRNIVMTGYVVRQVNGKPVIDGRLVGPESGWSIAFTDGTGSRRIDPLPSALETMAGARIWMAMREGASAPSAYGVIQDR